MFFPWLKLLKASKDFTDADILAFDETFAQIYERGYFRRFNARVYKYFGTNIDEEKWIKALDELTASDLLRKNFELCHPIEGNTVQFFENMSDIPLGETILLGEEEEELYVSESDVYVTYSFSDDFQPTDIKQADKRLVGAVTPKKALEDAPRTRPQSKSSVSINLAEQMRLYPGHVIDLAISEKIDKLRDLLQLVQNPSEEVKTQKKKGDLLEDLGELLLSSPYFKLHARNVRTRTSELDLVFSVKRLQETLFGSFSDLMVVECKNWSAKMSAKEVRSLSTKMEEVKSKTGVIFSKKGITGRDDKSDAKGFIRDRWREKDQIIMVFDLEDLSAIVKDGKGLYSLLEKKFHDVRLL